MFGQVKYPNGKTGPMKAGSSAHAHAAVVNDTDFADGAVCTGIYVGNGGNVTCRVNGVDVTYPNVASSFILPVEATRVIGATTTASGMVAMFG